MYLDVCLMVIMTFAAGPPYLHPAAGPAAVQEADRADI
jgi:hypothetical protein